MERAVVTGLSHATGVVQVSIYGGAAVEALCLTEYLPPPRSICWVQQVPTGGQYLLVGVEGPRSLVFHEDFCIVESAQANNTRIGCDTEWWLTLNGTGGVGDSLGAELGGDTQRVGAIASNTQAAAGAYQFVGKDPNGTMRLPATGGLRVHIRAMVSTLANVICQFGLGTLTHFVGGGAGAHGVSFRHDPAQFGGNWQLWSSVAGAYTSLDTGIPSVVNRWVDFDLVVVPGVWLGLWIDGTFALQNTLNIPPADQAAQAGWVTYAVGAATATTETDLFRVERISNLSYPV